MDVTKAFSTLLTCWAERVKEHCFLYLKGRRVRTEGAKVKSRSHWLAGFFSGMRSAENDTLYAPAFMVCMRTVGA